MTAPGSHLRPGPLELATTLVLGTDTSSPRLEDTALTPRRALEDAVTGALRRPPCLVQFSGGRDSSAALALAAHIARLEGLPLPIPFTYRFPDAPETFEDDWQEMIVGHLGLKEWDIVSFDDELDMLGPIARRAISERGVMFPSNGHMLIPALDAASGGSLITGMDADGLFEWRWAPAINMITRRQRPTPRAAANLAYMLMPSLLAVTLDVRRPLHEFQWLTPEARDRVLRQWGRSRSADARTWPKTISDYHRSRFAAIVRGGSELLAQRRGVKLLHLFLDPGFLAALAASESRFGFVDKTTSLRALFNDLVPNRLIERPDKPVFHIYFGPHSRAFAKRWDGGGIDLEIVDGQGLIREWSSPYPSSRVGLLLQDAWARTELEQEVGELG